MFLLLEVYKTTGKEQALFGKLEAVVNHFNTLGKYIIVNILVLYLTQRFEIFSFFNYEVHDELLDASAFANSVLRISEFTFRLSQSDWNENISKWENIIY